MYLFRLCTLSSLVFTSASVLASDSDALNDASKNSSAASEKGDVKPSVDYIGYVTVPCVRPNPKDNPRHTGEFLLKYRLQPYVSNVDTLASTEAESESNKPIMIKGYESWNRWFKRDLDRVLKLFTMFMKVQEAMDYNSEGQEWKNLRAVVEWAGKESANSYYEVTQANLTKCFELLLRFLDTKDRDVLAKVDEKLAIYQNTKGKPVSLTSENLLETLTKMKVEIEELAAANAKKRANEAIKEEAKKKIKLEAEKKAVGAKNEGQGQGNESSSSTSSQTASGSDQGKNQDTRTSSTVEGGNNPLPIPGDKNEKKNTSEHENCSNDGKEHKNEHKIGSGKANSSTQGAPKNDEPEGMSGLMLGIIIAAGVVLVAGIAFAIYKCCAKSEPDYYSDKV